MATPTAPRSLTAVKIVVITDAHANLPALTAVLAAAAGEGYDYIFHTGDAIGIGPYPAECLDALLHTPHLYCVRGNHDARLVDGLPEPQPPGMSDEEVQHQRWTHAAIDPVLRSGVAAWPYLLLREFAGVNVSFVHYALLPGGQEFAPVLAQPSATDLERLFARLPGALIFYGHHHPRSDIQGRARYVNPGSLGCYHAPLARYAVVNFRAGKATLEHRAVSYDDRALFRAFEQRAVPARRDIYRLFFGGRFP